MSYEAFGDDDARELPEGCWYVDQVDIVLECIKELVAEPVYEGGKKENGISTRFLARLTVLQSNAGLLPADHPLAREAEALLHPESHHIRSTAMNSAWDIVSTGNSLKAAWKCMECGRVVFKAGEPSAWQHLQHCSHSPHRAEETEPPQRDSSEKT